KAPAAARTPPPPTKAPAKPAAKAPAAPALEPAPAETPAEPAKTEPEPTTSAAASNDDDIAAMLLSMPDEGGTTSLGSDNAKVPDGTTAMEIPAATSDGSQPQQGAAGQAKPQQPESTSSAAKSLLEKYMRRPRGGGNAPG